MFYLEYGPIRTRKSMSWQLKFTREFVVVSISEAYIEPYQTSTVVIFYENICRLKAAAIFTENCHYIYYLIGSYIRLSRFWNREYFRNTARH